MQAEGLQEWPRGLQAGSNRHASDARALRVGYSGHRAWGCRQRTAGRVQAAEGRGCRQGAGVGGKGLWEGGCR